MRVARSTLVLLLPAAALSCRGAAPPPSPAEVAAVRRQVLPDGPADPAWRTAPLHAAPILLQDLVEPRLMAASTTQVRVQAISDGARVAFRLEWDDPTADDLPGAARFSDACAVQIPARIEPDVPAPQMGEAGRPVEISYWRASWQAAVNGRKDDNRALYPNAAVDHYPFEAPSLPEGSEARREMAARYAPARALGNPMEGPRGGAVEDLVADGPGTLRPAAHPRSTGKGERGAKGWSVVIARPLPKEMAGGGRAQAAFAVWEGSREEVGSRKMRTAWIPFSVAVKE